MVAGTKSFLLKRVATALVVPQSSRVPIRILNPGVESITLTKITPVAILEFVD